MEPVILHWICDAPSPYNAQLFKSLAADDQSAAAQLDLWVHYRRSAISSHPWQSSFTEGYNCRTFRHILGVDWKTIRLSFGQRSRGRVKWFIVGGWNHPTAWLTLLSLCVQRGNVIIWTDTPDQSRVRRGFRQWARSIFLRWVFTRARFIMGTGKPALHALELMGAPKAKLVNFPCWIDERSYLASVEERASRRREGRPIVFLSSGLVQNSRKGHDVALRSFAVARGYCGQPFEYRIAGSGPDEGAVRSLAESLGLQDCVKLLGWLEPEELIGQLAQADVFIHPSPVHEPYGVAVLEAMAAGLAILASDRTCAAIDRIIPGVNGEIHKSGDHEALAIHISSLLSAPNEIARLGEAAASTASQWPLARGKSKIKNLICREEVS
ncbi:glycosyltransferase [Mesorhizobium tianshanense]|uniref:Glycosyl transferase family 1 n=1 Tax=Mesorhizobium tianshanense TaxID=39844 RepID=A0A562NRQ1_9HYPH|nr:glycosyl transferase family 1 [Mesorhizobium tianshanense]